jgi:hypothetical protein
VSSPADPVAGGNGPPNGGAILADIRDEACRLLRAAQAERVPLRLIGGLAVSHHARGGVHPAVSRECKDIDFATAKNASHDVATLLTKLGYEPNPVFNLYNQATRLLFYDTAHDRQVDVFVGGFAMCHSIPIADRLDVDPETIPLAELLLTKLQIVHFNDKDERDTLALLLSHEVGDHDADAINGRVVAALCAADWGLWRTATLTLERVRDSTASYPFDASEIELVRGRIGALERLIEEEPKSRKWRMRSRIGERKRWYEIPDEVE